MSKKKKIPPGAEASRVEGEVDMRQSRHPRYVARDSIHTAIIWLIKAEHQVESVSMNPGRNYDAALRDITKAEHHLASAKEGITGMAILRSGSAKPRPSQ